MARKPLASSDKEIQDAIAAAATPDYQVEEYQDRRAIPADPELHQYDEEADPILAVGDPRNPRIVDPVTEPAPTLDELSAALQERSAGSPDASAPRIEIAHDADPVSRLAATMEKFLDRQSGPSPIDPALAALLSGMMKTMEALVKSQVAASDANSKAIRRGQDPSNVFAPDISCFNPRGEREHPRPKLQCKMFFPWEAEWESMTREEIELANLLEAGEYYVKRNDDSRIIMNIKTTIHPNTMKPERLLINHDTALNNDYHWLMPPMRMWLRQILDQRPHTKAAAKKVMSMEDEIALIDLYGVDFDTNPGYIEAQKGVAVG